MTRLILTLVLASMAVAAITVGTLASFSDTEGPGNNTLDAGTLDLKVGGDDDVVDLSFSNIKPGDTGTFAWDLKNTGSLDGDLDIVVGAVTDSEPGGDGADTEPESVREGILSVPANTGTLAGYIDAQMYVDNNYNHVCDGGDEVLFPVAGTCGVLGELLDLDDVAAYVPTNDTLVAGGADIRKIVIDWEFENGGLGDENDAQGDQVDFTMTYNLYQQAGSDQGLIGDGSPEPLVTATATPLP